MVLEKVWIFNCRLFTRILRVENLSNSHRLFYTRKSNIQQTSAYESDTYILLVFNEYYYLTWPFILKNKKDETPF